jgi:hypothetical protein
MSDEEILDDSALLADRLIRSLHRNTDGHVAANQQQHESSVELAHNVAILYIYTVDADEAYMLHEHYVYSHEPCNYQAWLEIVNNEIEGITANPVKGFVGIYGWSTGHVKITPLRNGDLFIKIDKDGARCVRLAFNNGKAKRKTRSKN